MHASLWRADQQEGAADRGAICAANGRQDGLASHSLVCSWAGAVRASTTCLAGLNESCRTVAEVLTNLLKIDTDERLKQQRRRYDLEGAQGRLLMQISQQCGLDCRHAAEGVSEAPTLTPLTLLGDFVTGVGKAPEKEALTTYFARLREQVGWPSSPTSSILLSPVPVPSTAKEYLQRDSCPAAHF